MAIRRDYILKMIEMIGDLIAGILRKIKKGDFDKAGESIDQAYQDFLSEDAAFFRKLNVEDFTRDFLERLNYSHGHLEILAELFYAEAELNNAKGLREASLEYYQKSLQLHRFVIQQSATFSLEKEKKLDSLQTKIDELRKN